MNNNMSDRGASALDSMQHSHTSTQQWKSFEMRMLQRRVARCLLRADVALDAGCTSDAREALEEVRRLGPSSPDLTRLELRLVQSLAPVEAAAGVFEGVEKPTPRRRALMMSLAACAAVLVAGWVGWQTVLLTRWTVPSRPSAKSSAPAQATLLIPQAARAEVSLPEGVDSVPLAVEDAPAATVIDAPPPLRARSEVSQPDGKPAVAEPEPTRGAAPVAPPTPVNPMPPPAAAPPTTGLPPLPLGTSGNVSAAASGTPPAPERETEAAPAEPPRKPASASAPADVEGVRVRAVLVRYEAAYSGLDAAAARAVWPGVDERALARAFDGLRSQQLSLGLCDVSVDGGMARADCSGSATWTPKVGGGGRTEGRRWRFYLQNGDAGWQITRAEAR